MRVLVDAMCAEYGGIRTYVEQLLGRWHALYPEDEVHVALRAGSTLPTPGLARHEYDVPGPDVLGRPLVQATRMHALSKRIRPDVVMATAPTTDVRRPRAPLAVVILDLRAELRPEQFSLARRALRKVSYERSYALAAGFLSISQRSLDDLHRLHPGTRDKLGVVAHLGADHAKDWPAPTRTGPAVGFAHHTNKNPELLLRAWARLEDRRDLLLLGVSRDLRPELERLVDELGLGGTVELAPFLDDDAFHAVISAAALIAFPSDFEGFGLPIVEGMLQGKPVVIGPDPGSMEVAGGHAHVAADWSVDALRDALEAGFASTPAQLEAARVWAEGFSWERTIQTTRESLARLSRSTP